MPWIDDEQRSEDDAMGASRMLGMVLIFTIGVLSVCGVLTLVVLERRALSAAGW
jgi:hypothetical protein